MDAPILIVLIEEFVQNERLQKALVRVYNNLEAQVKAILATLVPIILGTVLASVATSSSFGEVLNSLKDQAFWFLIFQQFMALFFAGKAKADRVVEAELRG